MSETLQIVVALAALGALPLGMLVAVALFERRDGQSRLVVSGGRVRRRATLERNPPTTERDWPPAWDWPDRPGRNPASEL